ncbi:MAG: hypothetical protein HFF08_03645 [Oscillospiraceae bacterium]|nr:hypothetical protein [Oscillospiraceae bacterium]
MDGIQSSIQPVSTRQRKYVHTEFGTFEDVSHEIQKVEGPVDTSHFKTVPWYDRDSWQRELRPGMLEMQAASGVGSVATSAAAALKETKVVMAEARSVTGKFYDGTISEEKFQSEYERLSERYVNAFCSSGYPDKLACRSTQCRLAAQEIFYDEFRKMVLEEAVSRNNAEGKQYATGEKGVNHTVKYYNSDYYYKSEAAVAAITKGALAVGEESRALCSKRGYNDYEFEVPDYKSDRFNLYDNFNSAWSNNFLADDQFITDYDAVPPKNFKWFYESGGNSSDTAFTWASCRDENGGEHLVSKMFNYKDAGKGLFRVSELLKFKEGGRELVSQVNRFLSSLQVFQRGYFSPDYSGAGRINVFA